MTQRPNSISNSKPPAQLWYEQSIDIDRLHDVLAGKYDGWRAAGHTFSHFVMLVHEALQGDPGNRYLYIGESRYLYEAHVMRPLCDVLVMEGFNIQFERAMSRVIVKDTDMMFLFYHPDRHTMHKLRGYTFNRMFVDLTPDTEWEYREQLHEISFRVYDKI